jgi:uncharacterized protein
MSEKLDKIVSFIDKHHVMSLATATGDEVSACSLFYAYEKEKKCFVVASSDETLHIQQINQNPKVAGNIVLETKTVGKIQGLQFKGLFSALEDEDLKKIYFKAFPHAKMMKPKLWQIDVDYFKLTDNRLGFGKKIIWQKND